MIERISPVYAKSEIEQAIYEAIGSEFDSAYDLVDEVLLQLFPQTATWGLSWWEKRLKLPTNLNEDIKIRRRKVIARMQTRSSITPEKIANIIESYTGVRALITEVIAASTFGVTLISDGEPFDVKIDEVIAEIRRIKPSHLSYSLGLETQKTINIATTRDTIFGSHINLCGDFYCGDSNVTGTLGRSYSGNLSIHGDYSKNIKDYSLAGTILSGINSEFENGIATIGRVYSANENIKASRDYLFDSQLSKTQGDILGTIYNELMKVAITYNNAINTYNESGSDEAGQFMTGSNETLEITIGKTYDSTLQEESNKSNTIKEYNYAGDMLASEEAIL